MFLSLFISQEIFKHFLCRMLDLAGELLARPSLVQEFTDLEKRWNQQHSSLWLHPHENHGAWAGQGTGY